MKRAVAFAFLLAFAAFSAVLKVELRKEKSPVENLKLEQQIADFTLPDRAGKEVSLKDAVRDHKIVMINFWGSWCAPCRVEMPAFEKLYREKSRNDFEILAVAEERNPADLDKYLSRKPVSFPVLVDNNGALADKLGIKSFPTTVIVDRTGKIRHVTEGVDEYVQFTVERLLAEKERR